MPAKAIAMLTSGAAKPTASPSSGVAELSTSENANPSVLLKNMTDLLSGRLNEAGVRKLLSDATTLREWQTVARPSHAQRDAMMKLSLIHI